MAWNAVRQLTRVTQGHYGQIYMKDSALRLQDKTILLVGPFNGVTQGILRTMTELGCDIAFMHDKSPNAHRYCEGLNEAREIHAHYGRAAHFALPLNSEREILDALGRLTESLGRVDVLVDARALEPFQLSALKDLANQVIPFLRAKQRGRVVYIFEDESLASLGSSALTPEARTELQTHLVELASGNRSSQITVNGLSLGVTEDYLLKRFPESASIRKSLEKLQAEHAHLRLVETSDVGMGVAYVASALSASVTGQILRLTQGFHL